MNRSVIIFIVVAAVIGFVLLNQGTANAATAPQPLKRPAPPDAPPSDPSIIEKLSNVAGITAAFGGAVSAAAGALGVSGTGAAAAIAATATPASIGAAAEGAAIAAGTPAATASAAGAAAEAAATSTLSGGGTVTQAAAVGNAAAGSVVGMAASVLAPIAVAFLLFDTFATNEENRPENLLAWNMANKDLLAKETAEISAGTYKATPFVYSGDPTQVTAQRLGLKNTLGQ